MNKRYLHHVHKRLSLLKVWYLLIAVIIFGGITLYALRQNNVQAIRLRDRVLQVDQVDGDVEAALKELREFVYSHMNADLAVGPSAIRPPIQLKYRYERLLAAEKERVSKENEKIYTNAQAICEKQFPVGLSGSGRIPCIQDYVAKQGVTERSIPDSLYKFDFTSPRWSSDLAGWGLVITFALSIILLVRLILDFWIKRRLSEHQ
jgi:hypothetical protein